ncbi:MAG: glycoside hydrolase family 13 protein, partial [Rubrivivax sp.]|nr:glycoside hydrolase family 13 protein [Rubrivivax sp.]
ANRFDREVAGRYEARERDWRNGAIVYQVFVDRFAPSTRLEAKRGLYAPPRTLRGWDEEPRAGRYLQDHKVWSHEIDFWGGDLDSLRQRLDHVQQLGADVLYLNPIVLAATNHKYDALDYQQVSPEYGTRDDVKALAADLHRRGMKLVLDGVFNHMGRQSARFREAEANPASPWRDWFFIGPQYGGGARSWWGAVNLPELNLENPAVRAHLWQAPDSVVRSWLRDGADGWRLDVAFDIGFTHLQALTEAAHAEKPGSLVVGEIPNYPKEWFPSVDGVMHFGLRRILIGMAGGTLDAGTAARMITRIVQDADYEHILKSWVYLDNHDTDRIATTLPDEARRRVAQVLQFTLPGAVNLYYGSEVGQEGGADPEMRGPMRWDRVAAGHPQLAWTKQLVALRKAQRALRVGDFRPMVSRELFAFERHTDRATDSVFVVANASAQPVTDTLLVGNSKVMDGSNMVDLLGQVKPLSIHAALMTVTVPPHTVLVLKHQPNRTDGYDNYKRVQ